MVIGHVSGSGCGWRQVIRIISNDMKQPNTHTDRDRVEVSGLGYLYIYIEVDIIGAQLHFVVGPTDSDSCGREIPALQL